MPLLLALVAAGLPAAAGAGSRDGWELVARCGGFLEGPVRLGSGDLAVSDPPAGRIWRVDRHGKCHLLLEGADLPNGQALDASGNLIVARSGGLMRVDPRTGATTPLVTTWQGKPLGLANDLSPDAHGGIYFTVPGRSSLLRSDGQVFYLAAGAAEPELVADGLAFPNGIAVSPDGDSVLVAEFAAKRILAIPTRHSRRRFNVAHVFALTEGGVGPDGLSFGGDGTLYAANIEAGTISRWTATGQRLSDLRLPRRAGAMVTNLLVERRWLTVTEAAKGEVWRIRLP